MTQKEILIVASIAVVLNTCYQTSAQVAAAATVVAVVENMKNDVEDVIVSLEGSADNTMFRARQNLELIIDHIDTVMENRTADIFSELNSTERQFFNSVQNHINELKEAGGVAASDAQRLANTVSNGIRGLPFASTYPVVLGYEPLFVPSGGADDEEYVRITISGVLLGSNSPTLIVNNTTCDLVTKIDAELVFLCDKYLFLAESTIEALPGKLIVYQKQGLFAWMFGSDPRKYNYNISLNVIPDTLGQATVSVSTKTMTQERNSREQGFSFRNAHCRGSREKLFPFNATRGWTIDPASITSSCSRSSRSSCNGIHNLTDRSFSYSCTIANSGRCGFLFRDGRGSCRGRVTWEEVREMDDVKEETLPPINLVWGKDSSVLLPQGAMSVRITVDKSDGTRRIVTDTDSSDPWFEIEVNLQDRDVIIRPSALEIAMR